MAGVVLAALAITTAQFAYVQAEEWELVWSDEFDGPSLDLGKWGFDLGTGAPDLTGWGFNELQYYTNRPENARLEDGLLAIVAREEPYGGMAFTSARLTTLKTGAWLYGKIEVRAKLPRGQGVAPAIWMLPTDDGYDSWPQSGKISIMEHIGREPTFIYGAAHYLTDWPNYRFLFARYELAEDELADFHLFAIEWEPGEVRWYVNGDLYYTVTPEDVAPHPYPFDQPFHLIINVAVGGDWPGNPDASTEFPQAMLVDYVRVYQDPRLTG